MYHLETVLTPFLPKNWSLPRLPFSRDQVMLLMAAINQFFLGLDTYLVHVLNGTIRPNEWIPIIFGPLAGVTLLAAGVIALKQRPLATILATTVLLASIIVGVLGAYFHLIRGVLPDAPLGQAITLNLLIWAPPILAPLSFALVGILGISAAWVEDPPDSGILIILGGWRLQLPYSKTQAYFYIVAMGILIALISSTLDHARSQFENPWLWLPAAVGIFALVVAATLGAIDNPTRADLSTYAAAMLLLLLTGVIGAFLHVEANLVAEMIFVQERFLRGAPLLAPLLYTNMGLLGLVVLLDPREKER